MCALVVRGLSLRFVPSAGLQIGVVDILAGVFDLPGREVAGRGVVENSAEVSRSRVRVVDVLEVRLKQILDV